jgi:hypothetical protein
VDLRVRPDVDVEVAGHRLHHSGCERCGTPSARAKFLVDAEPAQVVCVACFELQDADYLLAWLCAEPVLAERVMFSLTVALNHRRMPADDLVNGFLIRTPPGITPS